MADRKANRLIKEKSPYLLQHAYNPVDWYPWCDEAFQKAAEERKPIFLSIGYSTCHWCHVMEKESFEDADVAGLMNRNFVSIKVDREERTDLDHVYMTVCQMLTGSGGWPLTIVMTPEKKPFFAATYIPKETRFGRVGMMELIPRIQQLWSTRHEEVVESAEKIMVALQSTEEESAGDVLGETVLGQAYEELAARFDEETGGFSKAPKFPSPHNFLFMLRYWKRSGNEKALQMVEKTLRAMRRGGIYDQIGYGFHRYSTDNEWLVPHFEKMLYDQATLALAYLETYQATGGNVYGNTAREIFTYVLRDMRAPEGGFYSAEDADSEGVEGKFYVWEEREIRQVLEKAEADVVTRWFSIQPDGNFAEEGTGTKTGANILHLGRSMSDLASEFDTSAAQLEDRIASAGKALFETRERRVHPHKDDKVLTDWNGLMIAALARGARVLGDQAYARAAGEAAKFILTRMRRPDGRLLHRYRDGEAEITAHLDDYVFLIWGLIELYESTFDAGYLKTALDLNGDMMRHYWDERRGGLFFTPDDGEPLIVRKKEIYDGAIPSGNSVALNNLLLLARMTGRHDLDEKAEKLVRAFSEQIEKMPSGYTQFLSSVDFEIGPAHEVVVVGVPGAADTEEMLRSLTKRYSPNQVTLFRPSDGETPEIDALAGFVKNHVMLEGKATVYVCRQFACKAPTTSVTEMLEMIP
jgi:uncharacterized protein YyaL (SSP411 family)